VRRYQRNIPDVQHGLVAIRFHYRIRRVKRDGHKLPAAIRPANISHLGTCSVRCAIYSGVHLNVVARKRRPAVPKPATLLHSGYEQPTITESRQKIAREATLGRHWTVIGDTTKIWIGRASYQHRELAVWVGPRPDCCVRARLCRCCLRLLLDAREADSILPRRQVQIFRVRQLGAWAGRRIRFVQRGSIPYCLACARDVDRACGGTLACYQVYFFWSLFA
jgi:hypothetical protein